MAVNVLARSTDYTGKTVQSAQDGKQLGQITDIVFDSNSKKLVGFVLGNKQKPDASGFLFKEIQEIVEGTIFVGSEDAIKSLDETFKIQKSNGQKKASFSESKVISESEDQIGSLTDLYFDADTGNLVDIEIMNKHGNRQRIPVQKVDDMSAQMVKISSQGGQKGSAKGAVYKGKAKKQEQQNKQQGKNKGLGDKLQNTADKISSKAQEAVDKVTS